MCLSSLGIALLFVSQMYGGATSFSEACPQCQQQTYASQSTVQIGNIPFPTQSVLAPQPQQYEPYGAPRSVIVLQVPRSWSLSRRIVLQTQDGSQYAFQLESTDHGERLGASAFRYGPFTRGVGVGVECRSGR